MLNSTRCASRVSGFIQKTTTMHSITTVAVPAGVPKSKIDAKTKASETEMNALIEGTLTLKEPVSRVNRARITHRLPIGSEARRYTECTITAAPAKTISAI